MKGYVYILTNPAFNEDWVKIGRAEDVEQRIKVLSNKTCLPYAFVKYATCKTSKFKELEKQLHHILGDYAKLRVVPNREFFQIPPSKALNELRNFAKFIDDAEIEAPGEALETSKKSKSAPPFRFTMVDLKPGAELIFEPTATTVVVAEHKSNNRIEYKGNLYTLSGFCKEFMPDNKRNKADAYQGPQYFSYNGKLLTTIRQEKEK